MKKRIEYDLTQDELKDAIAAYISDREGDDNYLDMAEIGPVYGYASDALVQVLGGVKVTIAEREI